MKDEKFFDLTGDPVFDHIKTQMLPGNSILGARIIERVACKPKQARKIIRFAVKNHESGKTLTYDFNYLKVARQLSGLRPISGGENAGK